MTALPNGSAMLGSNSLVLAAYTFGPAGDIAMQKVAALIQQDKMQSGVARRDLRKQIKKALERAQNVKW